MKKLIVLIAALCLLLTACGQAAPEESPEAGETAGILSSFSTTDLEGNAVDQSIFSDYKLTMVNVWATSAAHASPRCQSSESWPPNTQTRACDSRPGPRRDRFRWKLDEEQLSLHER